ncbi:MAG: hypothetical protein A3F18_02265 [Legionellales bacterium RIFCSPHIGHO2_12_FULL_37_14]|nr:MAG: hypothetical protein A3F18_02265 [Legionellales bacterium RIFCSPHIGHO2_12_FULL_37_14]
MKLGWLTIIFPISILYACRILGLFLLIPVFTLFAPQLQDANSFRIGLALGMYGLAQSLMQIPFGLCSDYFGRKPLINFGLVLLLLGSIIGAYSTSIWGMIGARFLQGTGAIGSVLLALLSDLTPLQDRAKAMAVIGVSIGVSFSLAMMLAPVITLFFGLSAIFYFTACLAILGLIINYSIIPNSKLKPTRKNISFRPFLQCIKNKSLLNLNIGILFQHACLTSLFFVLPLKLKVFISLGIISASWQAYLPIIGGSFLVMAIIIFIAEKNRKLILVLKGSILTIAVAQLLLGYCENSYNGLITNTFIYFIAFNLLEAILPSQVSKSVDPAIRGTAMGIYSTFQFIGIFLGATMAGLIYSYKNASLVFYFNALLALLWFIINASLAQKEVVD